MNTALWIAQGILGLFVMAGIMKTFQPKEKLKERMPWVNDYSAGQVKLIGVAELLAGIGVIVPWLTGILPILTPIAAVGLAIIMFLAAVYHFNHKEYPGIGINAVFFALAVFVAYGRF
jgi:hypothetical protein